MLSGSEIIIAGLAAAAAGLVNALAGGGTLISFPVLIALGVPDVAANITNTVALCPGYLGGAIAQRKDLKGQQRRMWLLIPAGIIGGIAGSALLLVASEMVFHFIVPFLILIAAVLLAVQDRLRDWILKPVSSGRTGKRGERGSPGGRSRGSVWRIFRGGHECNHSCRSGALS